MKLNKFKKIGTVASIAAAMFAVSHSAHANTADTASADIVITATVVGQTCVANWQASVPVLVDLGSVQSSSLVSAGDIGAVKPFTLSLTGCDSAISKVSVQALGTGDNNNADVFANDLTGSNAASGVGVSLFGGDTQADQLKPDGSTSVDFAVNNGDANMTFLAKLERTAGSAGTVGLGSVSSTATLYMTYE